MEFSFLSVRRHVLAAVAFISVAVSAYAERVNVGNLWFEIDRQLKTAAVASAQEAIDLYENINVVYTQDSAIVPSVISVDGEIFTVTAIGGSAFAKSKIKTISLPPTLKSIGLSAFRGAEHLTEVIIPDGVKIEERIFQDAVQLHRVSLPSGITEIPRFSFQNAGLSYVAFPQTVKAVNSYGFKGACLDSGIFMNAGLDKIESEAFMECGKGHAAGLKEVVLPLSLNTIQEHAFYDSSVSRVWFSGSPQDIAVSAFSGMSVSEIIWATTERPKQGLLIGVENEDNATIAYDNTCDAFKDIKPSVKISTDPNATVGSKSPKGVPAEILGYLPPVSFAAGKIDLRDYTGLCGIDNPVYESSDQSVASVDGTTVKFNNAGIVVITTTTGTDNSGMQLIGRERRLCIMPVTVAVNVGDDGSLSYSADCMTEDQIKELLIKEAHLENVRVKDDTGNDWMIRYATGAEGRGLEFVYGTMAPTEAAPEVVLPELTVALCYGDDPVDLAEIDAVAAEGREIVYSSSDESVLEIDGTRIIPVGVGEVTVTASAQGVEFEGNGERTITVGPRKVTVKAQSNTIEDDEAMIPAVGFVVDGIVGGDSEADIVAEWKWDLARVEAGTYSALPPVLNENPLYDVAVSDEDARLYIVRAVTRRVADIEFVGRSNGDRLVVVALNGACCVMCGGSVVSGQQGSVSVSLGDTGGEGRCTLLCDYPEHISGIAIKSAGVTGFVLYDTLESLESVDLSGNCLLPGSIVVPATLAGVVGIDAGGQEPLKLDLIDGHVIDLGTIVSGGLSVRWAGEGDRPLSEGVDYNREGSVFIFGKTTKGVYAEVSDGVVSVRSVPMDIVVTPKDDDGGNDDLTGAIGDVNGDSENSIVDVYTLGGVLVKRGVSFSTAMEGLAKGTYVIGGKLYNVR